MYYIVKDELRCPVVGIDYPETFQDLDERFSSDDVSLDHIAKRLLSSQGMTDDGSEDQVE